MNFRMSLCHWNYAAYMFLVHFISFRNAEKSNFRVGAVIGNATPTQMHTVVIAVQQNNLVKIKSILDDISNIDSPNYGKHLTREKIAEYTKDQSRIDRVAEYFTRRGAKVDELTKHGEFLTMTGPISLWNAELNTTLLHKRLDSGDVVACAHSMDIPRALKADVFSFFNVLQTPPLIVPKHNQNRLLQRNRHQALKLLQLLTYVLLTKIVMVCSLKRSVQLARGYIPLAVSRQRLTPALQPTPDAALLDPHAGRKPLRH